VQSHHLHNDTLAGLLPGTLYHHPLHLQVYGIDVGYGQVAHKVRVDPRVTVIERFNIRYLTPQDLPCQVGVTATFHLKF
jgi:hypothetical protein